MQAGNLPDEVQKAIDQAESWQAESWLNLTTEISGVEVEQMTLNHFFLLDGIDSPFIKNRSFTPGDLGVFLWIFYCVYGGYVCQGILLAPGPNS